MSVTGELSRLNIDAPHARCMYETFGSLSDDPLRSSIEEHKVLDGRLRGIPKRLCTRESAGEIDSRWCVRPALEEKRGEGSRRSFAGQVLVSNATRLPVM